MTIEPFQIAIPDAALEDLRARLRATRWPDAVEGLSWDDGVDLAYMRDLCGYWADGFDWRAREAALNEFDHHKLTIDGESLHFIRQPARDGAIPLLMLHGWPGSVWQMTKILPLLTDRFEVIVPSLPGYGFSDAPRTPGMSVAKMAERMVALLDVLGHDKVLVRAGDIGAGVARELAFAHPERLIGLHQTGLFSGARQPPTDATEDEKDYFKRQQQWLTQEGAYALEHMSKPATLAVGLTDSPAGMAAWIVEKFRSWSDCGGDVESRFPRDELLTNLTIYSVTNTFYSSIRAYRESMGGKPSPSLGKRIEVPTAYAQAPKDITPGPRSIGERDYNVVRWTELARGGHFAEWEEPEAIANDLIAFLDDIGYTSAG